ncbi:MAG: Ig-like domain-containing protein [Moritella sp.]|uniref:Ig-like domain-containing protein n=1 Tax=Moritella sp. TaxID=78556 RepID=UPI0029AFD619|nr:Ig-like domain-containing protein [Moritella sp.]MDX2320164.1 Ig-like domain-containing protein [Moritella sp.]
MKYINDRLNYFFKYSLVASVMMLAGCDVEPQDNEKIEAPLLTADQSRAALAERRAQSLFDAHEFYSFPSNGQADVAVNTSVLLSFSHSLDNFSAHQFSLTDSDGKLVDVTSTEVTEASFSTNPQSPQANGLAFKPTQALKAGELYTVTYTVGLINEADDNKELIVERTVQEPLTFTTRRAKDTAVFTLDTNGFYPSDDLPFTTFTTLRFRTTNDIDPNSLVVGDTFKFQKVGSTEQITGDLIVKGRYLTFDPAVDLDAGENYQLIVSNGVKDKVGNSFAGLDKIFTVLDSGERAFKPMNVTMNHNAQVSPYSGELTNAVTIKSVLIGGSDTTYVDSDLVTELANLGNFDDASPLVIRKGSILNSSSLSVKVGGELPTGFDTGNIRMINISDATGYLINNTSSDHKYAPKQLHLFMDVAMTTDGYDEDGKLNGQANGGLSQNIMHLELMGTVRTEGASMIIDAVSEIDIKILGVENAHAQVSFHMESYTADEAPEAAIDIISPKFQSAYPGQNSNHFSLGDNIIVTYNEPLGLDSLQSIQLKDSDGRAVKTDITQDGSSIVIDPQSDLISSTRYEITGNVVDMAGNPAYFQQSFSTPYKVQSLRATAPMVQAMVPGYACALAEVDYANDIAGQCSGALDSDQRFNIFSLQQNRDIFVAFSQPIDKTSLALGLTCDTGSFRVEVINTNGECLSTVPGAMKYDNKILTFTPNAQWQDLGENLYRYTLMSAKFATQGEVDCNAGTAVCSNAGYPLLTTLLKNKSVEDQGGPDMRVPFRAVPADKSVFNPLMMPTTDSNNDYRWNDTDEDVYSGNFAGLSLTKFSGGITEAKLGCDYEESCNSDKSKTYISGFMPTEVGEYDPINDRIPVKVHAQTLASSDVYVKTTVIGILPEEVPTNTMVMRPLYPVIDGKSAVPEGYITQDAEGNLQFSIDLRVYMDNPFMEPPLNSTHNLHSYEINLNLQGPLTFLDDGRMNIQLTNLNQIDLDVEIVSLEFIKSYMTMSIMPGDMSLQQLSLPMK